MRQCTVKPAQIGHALQRRSCRERQTRTISSVFYIIPFYTSLKQLRHKDGTASEENFFQSSSKKGHLSHTDRNKTFTNSEKRKIKLNIFVNFLEKKHFFIL